MPQGSGENIIEVLKEKTGAPEHLIEYLVEEKTTNENNVVVQLEKEKEIWNEEARKVLKHEFRSDRSYGKEYTVADMTADHEHTMKLLAEETSAPQGFVKFMIETKHLSPEQMREVIVEIQEWAGLSVMSDEEKSEETKEAA